MAIKQGNKRRSVVITEEFETKILNEAEKDCSNFNAVFRKILTSYFNKNEKKENLHE